MLLLAVSVPVVPNTLRQTKLTTLINIHFIQYVVSWDNKYIYLLANNYSMVFTNTTGGWK